MAWYRKRFEVPESARGRYYAIEIDGAMSNATVFLNGHELGGRPYGYIGFALDLTPHLRFGGENVIAVRLAPEPESSRWYPGAGLYRHVWIDATGPVHVERWGTYVTTPAVSDAGATVAVRTELRNREARPGAGHPRDGDPGRGRPRGRPQPRRSRPCPPARPARSSSGSPSPRPRAGTSTGRTSTRAVSTVRRGDVVLDRYETPFGIRTIEYGPGKGFLLNGRRVPLQGRVQPPRPRRARGRP